MIEEVECDTQLLYIGCIGVNKSMRTLDLATRSEVAKECIKRLCLANGIDIYFKTNRGTCVDHMIAKDPNLEHSRTEVELTVTSTNFNVINHKTKEVIVEHEIRNVSFASRGDPETSDFVGYVANDMNYGRACFVIKCTHDAAKELLNTIAMGFENRSQQLKLKDEYELKNSRHTPSIKDTQFFSFYSNSKINNENNQNFELIEQTRALLRREPWYHGSNLERGLIEERLKQDGDFLVRESMLDPGQFVLSVMNEGDKLHLLFDSMGKVRMENTTFDNISHLVRHHLEKQVPIVAHNRHLYLRKGVRPPPKSITS